MMKLNPDGVPVQCNKALRGFEPSEMIGIGRVERVVEKIALLRQSYTLYVFPTTIESLYNNVTFFL